MLSKNNHAMVLILSALAFILPEAQAASAGRLVSVRQHMNATGHVSPGGEVVELGKKLFFDRRLSGDGTMSCATCHNPELGFSDGLPISLSYPTTRNWRNSSTLVNVAFKDTLFHDGRSKSLEEQALFPMVSAFEMNQDLDYMEEELRAVPAYIEEFQRVFGKGGLTRQRVAQAIAAFERTLLSTGSPLDGFLEGDAKAMGNKALMGMKLFTGKAGCIRCHHGVNLSDGDFHRTGVPEDPAMRDDPRTIATVRYVARVAGYDKYSTLATDPGRYLVTGQKRHWKAFATPTLRDLSRTAPYMHNGMFDTVEQVVEFYNAGGGAGNTAGLLPLGLSADEKTALSVFLIEALAGESVKIQYPRIP